MGRNRIFRSLGGFDPSPKRGRGRSLAAGLEGRHISADCSTGWIETMRLLCGRGDVDAWKHRLCASHEASTL